MLRRFLDHFFARTIRSPLVLNPFFIRGPFNVKGKRLIHVYNACICNCLYVFVSAHIHVLSIYIYTYTHKKTCGYSQAKSPSPASGPDIGRPPTGAELQGAFNGPSRRWTIASEASFAGRPVCGSWGRSWEDIGALRMAFDPESTSLLSPWPSLSSRLCQALQP